MADGTGDWWFEPIQQQEKAWYFFLFVDIILYTVIPGCRGECDDLAVPSRENTSV
jgi:hypothetical protein